MNGGLISTVADFPRVWIIDYFYPVSNLHPSQSITATWSD
jgi:hypothetical protein